MKIAAIVTILIALTRLWYLPTVVSGDSMEPTLSSGEMYLANQRAYVVEVPDRGDVVFAREAESEEVVVKRIIGLPGEEVKMIWGKSYINGVLLDEPYRHPKNGWCMLPVRLGEGEYWIIGDNRDISSHHTVGRGEIIGKLIGRRDSLLSAG